MFENIKLICSDIDGTLVDNSRVMGQTVIDTIQKLKKHGYIFGLASGRPLRDVQLTLKDWGASDIYDFIVAWNGCELLDCINNKQYQYNIMSKDEVKEVVDFMSRYECVIHMYYKDQYLTSSNTDRAWYSAFRNKREYVVTNDLSTFYQSDSAGIMFRVNEADMPQIEKEANEFCKGKNYVAFKTQPNLIEFGNRYSNKAYGLRKICEIYNINLKDVMSFGDTTNDNPMFEISYGVCLLNGSDDTKKLAKMITKKTVDENGITDFANEYLL